MSALICPLRRTNYTELFTPQLAPPAARRFLSTPARDISVAIKSKQIRHFTGLSYCEIAPISAHLLPGSDFKKRGEPPRARKAAYADRYAQF
jgi:hypothetical protein